MRPIFEKGFKDVLDTMLIIDNMVGKYTVANQQFTSTMNKVLLEDTKAHHNYAEALEQVKTIACSNTSEQKMMELMECLAAELNDLKARYDLAVSPMPQTESDTWRIIHDLCKENAAIKCENEALKAAAFTPIEKSTLLAALHSLTISAPASSTVVPFADDKKGETVASKDKSEGKRPISEGEQQDNTSRRVMRRR